MSEFTQALQKDQTLRDTIRHFVPQEAKKDPHHPFWNQIAYSVLEQYNPSGYYLMYAIIFAYNAQRESPL